MEEVDEGRWQDIDKMMLGEISEMTYTHTVLRLKKTCHLDSTRCLVRRIRYKRRKVVKND